jgi:hypothetical protein
MFGLATTGFAKVKPSHPGCMGEQQAKLATSPGCMGEQPSSTNHGFSFCLASPAATFLSRRDKVKLLTNNFVNIITNLNI